MAADSALSRRVAGILSVSFRTAGNIVASLSCVLQGKKASLLFDQCDADPAAIDDVCVFLSNELKLPRPRILVLSAGSPEASEHSLPLRSIFVLHAGVDHTTLQLPGDSLCEYVLVDANTPQPALLEPVDIEPISNQFHIVKEQLVESFASHTRICHVTFASPQHMVALNGWLLFYPIVYCCDPTKPSNNLACVPLIVYRAFGKVSSGSILLTSFSVPQCLMGVDSVKNAIDAWRAAHNKDGIELVEEVVCLGTVAL